MTSVRLEKIRVGKGLLNEFRFSRFKETGEEVYGSFHLFCSFLKGSVAAEERGDRLSVELCADDAELSGDIGGAGADVYLAGNVVEVEPASVGCGENALCAENGAVFSGIKLSQAVLDRLRIELFCGLNAPTGEHVVGVVMSFVVVVMVMMALAVGVAAFFIIVVVMVMVVMLVFFVMMMVMMLILVIVVIVVMVVMVFVVVIIIVVMMVMAFAVGIVALVIVVIIVMVMMVVVVLLLLGKKSFKLGFKRVLLFHRLKDLLSVKLVPRGGDEGCILIDAADYPDRLVQLVLRYSGGAAEYDGRAANSI